MKKLHEMFPIIFKKPEKVSKELLSFEEWCDEYFSKVGEEDAKNLLNIATITNDLDRYEVVCIRRRLAELQQLERDRKLSQLGI